MEIEDLLTNQLKNRSKQKKELLQRQRRAQSKRTADASYKNSPYFTALKKLRNFVMETETKLPFEVDQLVEEKSFDVGFRGAWFRCRIKKIDYVAAKCLLEYIDYPDDNFTWSDLYQIPPLLGKKAGVNDTELMLRPFYPAIYNQKDIPLDTEMSQVAVVIDEDWRLGDLVDWWSPTSCWWSGRIIELFHLVGKATVEFLRPPHGEGTVEEVFLKDIRPTLDWSPEHSWMVRTQDGARACARLSGTANLVPVEDDTTKTCVQGAEESTFQLSVTQSSYSIPKRKSVNTKTRERKVLLENTVSRKQEKPNKRDTSAISPAKQYSVALNSAEPDPTVAAVLDLEECLNRVKWLKAILQDGISCFNDVPESQWSIVHQ